MAKRSRSPERLVRQYEDWADVVLGTEAEQAVVDDMDDDQIDRVYAVTLATMEVLEDIVGEGDCGQDCPACAEDAEDVRVAKAQMAAGVLDVDPAVPEAEVADVVKELDGFAESRREHSRKVGRYVRGGTLFSRLTPAQRGRIIMAERRASGCGEWRVG